MFKEINDNGLILMCSDKIKARHGFTTRYGGVSTGDFESLNLGSNRGDEPQAVRENYRRLCAVFGVGEDDCAVTKQVHGAQVRIVTEKDRHKCMSSVPYEADGVVTNVKGMPIMCFVADCVPVLLHDNEAGIAAAVHCGWRSSVADILGNAVEKMCSLGARAENICAAMGAAIGKCCFETDGDVPQAIDAYIGGDEAAECYTLRADGKYMVDLRLANKKRLLQLGLREENIDISTECTYCSHDKYWSHRYCKGKRGSQGAVIALD